MMASLWSYALDIMVLMLAAWATPLRGARLFTALLLVSWLIGSFSLVIEAAAFSVMTPQQALSGAAMDALRFAVMAGLITAGATRWRSSAVCVAQARFTPLRLTGVVISYLVLYVGAGLLVLPYVREFYAGRAMPSLGLVLPLQVFRALLFVAGSALLLRGGLRFAPWILGAAFSIVGGIAPLLPDNPFMPLAMRLPHMVEVGVSNFLLGFIVGNVLQHRSPSNRNRA
jgi:hypothetical protein